MADAQPVILHPLYAYTCVYGICSTIFNGLQTPPSHERTLAVVCLGTLAGSVSTDPFMAATACFWIFESQLFDFLKSCAPPKGPPVTPVFSPFHCGPCVVLCRHDGDSMDFLCGFDWAGVTLAEWEDSATIRTTGLVHEICCKANSAHFYRRRATEMPHKTGSYCNIVLRQ